MTHSIVVGGSKGLGRVVTRQLTARGDRVSVLSRRCPAPGDQVDGASYHAVDISDVSATQAVLDAALECHGRVSYLVFCQRYRGAGDPWTGEFDVSLSAPKRVVEALEDRFDEGADAAIVFVSSVYADRVGDSQGLSYHVGKAGINQMARYYAVNLARKGIRTNTVKPFTYLKDESKAFYLGNQELLDLYAEIIPLGRMATSEDSANVISFLCSAGASFINGQEICVDGGLSLVWPETLARNLKAL